MSQLLVILILVFYAQFSFADPRPCVKAEYDLLSQMATSAGYNWGGTLATCSADENPGFAIYWARPAAGGVMQATLLGNPDRMQFTQGGAIRLFCMRVTGGRWQESGKDC